MRRTGILAVAAAIGGLTSGAPAFADFGAIAYDRHNCAVGRSWHFVIPRHAAEIALGECGHRGCEVTLEVGPGQCGALAVTENCRGYGWTKRESRDRAKFAAMESCQRHNAGQCSIRTVDRNR